MRFKLTSLPVFGTGAALIGASIFLGVPPLMEALDEAPRTEAEAFELVNKCAAVLGESAVSASEVPGDCSQYSFGYILTETVTVEDFKDQYSGESTTTKIHNLPARKEFLEKEIPTIDTDEERKGYRRGTAIAMTIAWTVFAPILYFADRSGRKRSDGRKYTDQLKA